MKDIKFLAQKLHASKTSILFFQTSIHCHEKRKKQVLNEERLPKRGWDLQTGEHLQRFPSVLAPLTMAVAIPAASTAKKEGDLTSGKKSNNMQDFAGREYLAYY